MVILDKQTRNVRKLLFTPCETREHLYDWINYFLGLRLPNVTVSEESNSNPFELIWETYSRSRSNELEDYSRVMAYASRFGGKTLSASVLEVLTVVHLKRDVIHMAAIKEQSKKAQDYVKGFLNRPHLRDFFIRSNATEVKLVWYTDNETILTEGEFESMVPSTEKARYTRNENYVRIIACTMASTNGQHTNGIFVNDELDVISPENIKAYKQARSIPSSSGGIDPITLLTSTRKSRIGLVQAEIDQAAETGLQLRHWNIIDVTEPCKPDRHKPELPKQTYYINDNDVNHITQEAYDQLPEVMKTRYYPKEGFAGCGSCRLFAACKGRLATVQQGDAKKTAAMSTIRDVIGKFKANPPEYIITEYLCRKPDTSGLVYPRLSRETHMKTAIEMAEIAAGEKVPSVTDRGSFIQWLKSRGAQFYSGMDFGFSHEFAFATFAVYGANAYVLDCFAQAGLEQDDQISSTEYIKDMFDNPLIYPDIAYPGTITTFRKRGFRMKDWDKNAGSKLAGIEIVRTMIWSQRRVLGEMEGLIRMFFLKDDSGVDHLFKQLEHYRLKIDSAGRYTEEPEDFENDTCDALRYGIMNVFGRRGAMKGGDVAATVTQAQTLTTSSANIPGQQQEWMKNVIAGALNGASPDQMQQIATKTQATPSTTIKKGRFYWGQ